MRKFFKKKKLKQFGRIGITLLFFLLQLSFLFAILAEALNTPLKIVFVIIIAAGISLAFLKLLKENSNYSYPVGHPLLVFFVVLGAGVTYFLSTKTDLGPVISAGLVGLIASFFSKPKKHPKIFKNFPAAIYCGCFVGMCSSAIVGNFMFIIFAGLLSGLLFIFSTGTMVGFGGKLGTIAFAGVSLASLFIFLFL